MEIQEVDKIPDNIRGRGGRKLKHSEYKDIGARLNAMNGLPLKITFDDKNKWKGITRFIYSCVTEDYRFSVVSDIPNKTIYIKKVNRKETENV